MVIPELDRRSDDERAREHEPTGVFQHSGETRHRPAPLKIVELGARDRAAVLVVQRARRHLEREYHQEAGDVDVTRFPRLPGRGEGVEVDEVRERSGEDDVAASFTIDRHGGVGEDAEDRARVRGRPEREKAQRDA